MTAKISPFFLIGLLLLPAALDAQPRHRGHARYAKARHAWRGHAVRHVWRPRVRVVTPFVSVDAALPLWGIHAAVVHHDSYVEEDYGYEDSYEGNDEEYGYGDGYGDGYGYGDEGNYAVEGNCEGHGELEVEEIRHNADHMFADLEAEARIHEQPAHQPEAMPEVEAFDEVDFEHENYGTMEPEPMAPAHFPSARSGDDKYNREMEGEILQLINEERSARGLESLRPNSQLREAARQHSKEMNELDYFSHESPVEAYETLPMRLRNAGVAKYGWAGENIAMSTAASAERFVQMWMNSPGHRANILKPEFEFSGIGVYGSGQSLHATQVFSSSR